MFKIRKTALAVVLCALTAGGLAPTAIAQNQPFEPKVGQPGKDVIWVPTAEALVDRMLDMAKLTPQDYLVDLGSGDGRTVIAAARRGARAHGIEYDADMVVLSQRNAQLEGVADRATFERADIFESDFSNATVVTLFLLPQLNLRLRPTLLDMKPGTRVVSNTFDMADWEPDETARAAEGCTSYCVAHKWIVPAKVEGTWQMDGRELVLTQKFQKLEGSLRQGGHAVPIQDARMDGVRISFTAGNQRYTGEVDGKVMKGTANNTPWVASRAGQ